MKMTQSLISFPPLAGIAYTLMVPNTQAQDVVMAQATPSHTNLIIYLFLGALLVLATVLLFVYRSRFRSSDAELKDISTELEHARQRFTETSQTLEKTELTLKSTTQRYQTILFDAEIGMFQVDRKGKCTYINAALQKMSGLYLKKAQQEGLQCVIHPDDQNAFNESWKAFMKGDGSFEHSFRFKLSKNREVYAHCRANKVLNEKKEVESYIGWVSNITGFHEEHLHEQAKTSRYERFIEETVEGYYHLSPDEPISLADSVDKVASTILEQMKLSACNETFAGLYGKSSSALLGKSMSALKDGCGPFKDAASIKNWIENEYKLINLESVRQDPRGNRLNLVNHAIGIVENSRLVGIWGSQRNISQQKREKEELKSQAQFMHRILDALPADVHVKDTRCRYLYASRKLAERTGIPQEDWIGKTIHEVMPATSRDHDKNAIEVMKSGKLSRIERAYEARKKSGWMETIQIPLVSEDGLIEGVVGLSLDASERKKHEEEILNGKKSIEQQLQKRTKELQRSQDEHGKAATALRNTSQELRIRESELETQRTEFEEQLHERKQAEETLQRSEETLLTRQKQLEEQLSNRLSELESETDKRKKWEELLTIKETELRKLEEVSDDRAKQLTDAIASREKAEADLKAGMEELDQQRQEAESNLTARKSADGQLTKTATALQTAQKRIQSLLEQHATELEHEVAERKSASAKLVQNAEELDELKRKFNERIEEETKALKKELGQKQIQEKALRQQSKDLETRIKELEKTVQNKIREHNKQVQEREGAEVQRQQIEQKLDHLSKHQKQLVERETQKLNLQIAEIKLEEIKLRKGVGDLEQEREKLQSEIKDSNAELNKSVKEQEKLSTALTDARNELRQLKSDQDDIVEKETRTLQQELREIKQAECDLRKQEELLMKQGEELEQTIKKLKTNLKAEIQNRETVETELNELQVAFNASQENVGSLIIEKTRELNEQISQHKKNEEKLMKAEASLKKQAEELQQVIETRTAELEEAKQEREKAEAELTQVIERSSQGAQEIEAKIAEIREEHLQEIQRINDEHQELREQDKHYRTLFQDSKDAFLQLDLKSGKIQSANPAAAQLFGEETEEALTGKTLDALSPERQRDETPSADIAKARLHSAMEKGQESFEWMFLDSDEAAIDALVSLSTVQVDEKQFILAVISNITAIKRRQADLQEMLAEAQEANLKNSEIVDEVTETVETTLQPVVDCATSIAGAENLEEKQKKDMDDITHSCRTLIDTMHYRRELGHIADGSDEVEVAKCDLHELIKSIDEQFTHRADTKNIFFAISYAQYQSANNVPKFVGTDEHKLRTILSILIGYALAHTKKGRLGLHATRESDDGEDVRVAFELAYTGSTAKDDLLSEIFGQGDTEAVDVQFGLTLAHRYVRMLNGEISLEYRQGDTTVLTFELPCQKAASEIVMPGAEPQAGAA